MPDTTWPIDGHPPGSSRSPDHAPVLMSSVCLSTRQQRFTRVRLSGPHLTPLTTPFPHRSPRRSSTQRSMRWFEASPRRAAPKGHTFISRTAPFPEAAYNKLPFMFRTQDLRQPLRPQSSGGPQAARRTPAIRAALHPDLLVVAEPNRAVVRRVAATPPRSRGLLLPGRTDLRARTVDQILERERQAVQVDQDRRPDHRRDRTLLREDLRTGSLAIQGGGCGAKVRQSSPPMTVWSQSMTEPVTTPLRSESSKVTKSAISIGLRR
jgi:hypothetical protein